MLKLMIGAFLVGHGLIHLLYFGQSRRLFALQPGLVWPDGAWAFVPFLDNHEVRLLISNACLLAAAGFVVGGLSFIAEWAWWRPLVIGVALFATALWILCWDGRLQKLAEQGGLGLLINLAILAAIWLAWWLEGRRVGPAAAVLQRIMS